MLDNSMPVMSGKDCAKEIRRLQADLQIPLHTKLFLVTGDIFSKEVMQELELIFDEVIPKPIFKSGLFKALDKL